MSSILESRGFAAAIFDALTSHICVVDKNGVIVAVNRAWLNFTRDNSSGCVRSDVGVNYLTICESSAGPGSEGSREFAEGLQSVLDGTSEFFQMEYPCHSPRQNRWFLGRATPLGAEQGGAVISHLDISDRKLVELELARLAATDALTGLPNRRYFMETAGTEVERVRRFGASASVVMIDVDHFKTVNDTYGHALGDEALRSLAKACKGSLRKADVFARLGGEEFVILLPGTKEAGARSLAEKLRLAVAKTPVSDSQQAVKITASFGVTEIRPSDLGIDQCLRRADIALYEAKSHGRNRVMSFEAFDQGTRRLSA